MTVAQRPLGNSGLAVSEIGFGCGPGAGLMVGDDRETGLAAVRRALDLGITYFDTAAAYGDGQSETRLGDILHTLDARPVIGTKITLELPDLNDIGDAVERSITGSLRRLGVDRLDVVHLHNRVAAHRAIRPPLGSGAQIMPQDVLGNGGVVDALARLRDRGLVGAFGCCAYGGEKDAILELVESDHFDAMLVHYSLMNPSAWRGASGDAADDYQGVAASAAARGMGIVALRILEAGVLAGASLGTPQQQSLIRRLAPGGPGSPNLTSLAVRFVLSQAAVSTALIGVSSLAHVEEATAAAAEGPLPADLLESL